MKILLACNGGYSTGVLVDAMKEYCQKEKIDFEIKAVGTPEAKNIAHEWDVILLGPQVAYSVSKFREMFPDKPVDSISPMSYGRLDGEAVVKQVQGMIKK